MSKQFIVGNFMPAYSDAFRYPERYTRSADKVDAEWLEKSMTRRRENLRARQHSYVINLQAAAVVALLLALGATTIDIHPGGTFALSEPERETVALQEITQTVQQELPPAPPRPAVPIEVPNDETLADADLNLDATLDIGAVASVAEMPPPPPKQEEAVQDDENEVFVVVEDRPEMIGGIESLARAVQYPAIARQAGIEGMVVVKIIVNKDGEPEDPVVLRSPSDVLDKAAIKAVMAQRFKPGRQRGRAVAVYMAIPVRFRLTENKL